jgi:TRAP transporter TAXI family solute receptor
MKTLLIAAAVLAVVAGPVARADQTVNVLTGGTSGVYYPLGVALARIIAKNVKGAKASVQSTKASAENLNLLQAGRGDIAFTLGDTLADAWTGNENAGFKTPLKKLRGLAAIYPNYIQIVARADSGIRGIADLKGERVSVGAPNSGTELNARAIFGANGITYSDFARTEYLPFGESVRLIRNRRLDATLISAGLGVAAIRDLASTAPITVVAITPAEVARIGNPVFQPVDIPAHTYTGQDRAVPTVAIQNYLVTREGLPEALIYDITKAIFENLSALAVAHPAAKGLRLSAATQGMPLPLHPGAAKFYREKGLLK